MKWNLNANVPVDEQKKARKPLLVNKYLITAVIFILLIVSISLYHLLTSNPVGATPKIYKESLSIFNVINIAYEENRLLNNVERIKLEEYRQKAEEWKEDISSSGNFTKKDEIDLRIMTDIEIMANWYEFQSDTDLYEEDGAYHFLESYNASKSSLGLKK